MELVCLFFQRIESVKSSGGTYNRQDLGNGTGDFCSCFQKSYMDTALKFPDMLLHCKINAANISPE